VVALVQFPFSAPIYFLYVAPLGVVAAAVVLGIRFDGATAWPVFGGALLLFTILFPVRWIRPGFTGDLGVRYTRVPMTTLLTGRGQVWVTPTEGDEYNRMVAEVAAHARGGYVYATPDCPEVNVLTGTRNPTRTLFDFFDDPVNRTARIMAQLDSTGV